MRIPNNWVPRPDQKSLWIYLQKGGKRAVEVAHRRWGKDDVGLHYSARAALERKGNYWHMLPAYAQARKVIWNAINPRTGKRRIDEAFPSEIRRGPAKSHEMMIELANGSIWQLVGSDTYNTVVGAPPIGIVFSEWALANPLAWAYLAPILEENGGWALFIYTSRGNNHGKTIYEHALKTPGWYAQRLTAHESPVFTADQLQNIKAEYIGIFGEEMGIAIYEQEYECSWEGAIFGSYWAKDMRKAREEGRITKVPYQTGLEVDTFWDLGVDDSTTIWFMQIAGKAFHFIDYYENVGYGMAHYAKILREKKYIYGNHWMPHDADHRKLDSNVIARAPKEAAELLGISPVEVVQRARNMDVIVFKHIPAVRDKLSQCWFDAEKCAEGIRALENYRAEYDEEKKVLSNRPVHDWASHGASAFITFAVGYEETYHIERPPLPGYMPHPLDWMR